MAGVQLTDSRCRGAEEKSDPHSGWSRLYLRDDRKTWKILSLFTGPLCGVIGSTGIPAQSRPSCADPGGCVQVGDRAILGEGRDFGLGKGFGGKL